jgi:hypothetical protein
MKYSLISAALILICGSLAIPQQSQKPQVLFSGPPPAAAAPPTQPPPQNSKVTDDERRAVAITAWDLDLHFTPRNESFEAHARVTLHNDGSTALSEIPLQLSSSLHFETIGLNGKRLTFSSSTLNSDADHTGQLVEAAVPLANPLAQQAELTLDVDYGGAIPLTAQRLVAIGAPAAQGQASDWDRISPDFIGLRGFGNVVWYPVSSVPILLGDGARLFNEIGRQKLLDQNATVALRITDEFQNDQPNAAILNGHFVPLDNPTSMPTASFPGIITASLPAAPLSPTTAFAFSPPMPGPPT